MPGTRAFCALFFPFCLKGFVLVVAVLVVAVFASVLVIAVLTVAVFVPVLAVAVLIVLAIVVAELINIEVLIIFVVFRHNSRKLPFVKSAAFFDFTAGVSLRFTFFEYS